MGASFKQLNTRPASLSLVIVATLCFVAVILQASSSVNVIRSQECDCSHIREQQSFVPPHGTAALASVSAPVKNSPLRYPPGRQYYVPAVQPNLGKHRKNADAIFAMATGYEIDDHLITVGSLLDTNYKGDIVLGVQKMANCTKQLQTFLKYHAEHSNLVVYEMPDCVEVEINKIKKCYQSSLYAYINPYNENKTALSNGRKGHDSSGRYQTPRKFRYEHYWIWQRNYGPDSKIMISDFRDLVFQGNPMEHYTLRDTKSTTLHLFEEAPERRITEIDRFTGNLMAKFFGPGMLDVIGNQTVLCSGVSMGGKVAIEQYLLLMVWHMDNLLHNKVGKGDQAHHNVLYYMGEMTRQTGIDNVKVWGNFHGAVATTGYTYRAKGMDAEVIKDDEGIIIPIIHQFDRSRNLNNFIKKLRETRWQPQNEKLMNTSLAYVAPKGVRKPS